MRWFCYALVADDWYKRHLHLSHKLYVGLVYRLNGDFRCVLVARRVASDSLEWVKHFDSVQYKNKYNPLAAALGYHSVKTSGAQSEGSSTHVAVRLDVW